VTINRKGLFSPSCSIPALCLCILALCFLPGTAAAAIQTFLGSTLHLAGISYGSSSVYLFVTGPNLPSEGAALNNIAAGEGRTQVSVDVDGSWSYDWDTHAVPLDAGSYTVWVVDAPVGRSGLSGHDYSTITVMFSRPYVSISTPVVPGSLEVHAVPENSSVVVGGQYRGMTPLTIGDLAPATYTVTVSHFGYHQVVRSVPVEGGSTTVITVTLAPQTGSIRIVSEPLGAGIILDGNYTGTAPLTLRDIPAGNHTIVAKHEGYTDKEQVVSVPAGMTVNVSLMLGATSPAPSATRAGEAVSSAVVLSAAAGIIVYAALRRE